MFECCKSANLQHFCMHLNDTCVCVSLSLSLSLSLSKSRSCRLVRKHRSGTCAIVLYAHSSSCFCNGFSSKLREGCICLLATHTVLADADSSKEPKPSCFKLCHALL